MKRPAAVLVIASFVLADEGPSPGARPVREWRLSSTAPVVTVMFDADGEPVAIDLSGAGGRLLDAVEPFPRFGLHGVASVAVLPDASVAFVGRTSGEVWSWHLGTGKRARSPARHASTVACAAVSPDRRLVATGS